MIKKKKLKKKYFFYSVKPLDSFFVWKMMAQIREFHSEKLLLVLARSSVQSVFCP